MSISGDVFADMHAQRAPSRALPFSSRTVLRLVVLLGATVAAVLLGASAASADKGSGHSGIGGAVGHVVAKARQTLPQKAIPRETVTAPARRVVPKKAIAPRHKAAPRIKVAPRPTKVDVAEPLSETVASAVAQTRSGVEKTSQQVVRKVVGHAKTTVAPVRNLVAQTADVVHSTADRALQVGPPLPQLTVTEATMASLVRSVAAAGSPAGDSTQRSGFAGTLAATGGSGPSLAAATPPATADTAPVHAPVQAPAGGPMNMPTVPAQGPAAQMGSGLPTGALAALDVILHDVESGLSRHHAGDEPTPRSRAESVDTRPA